MCDPAWKWLEATAQYNQQTFQKPFVPQPLGWLQPGFEPQSAQGTLNRVAKARKGLLRSDSVVRCSWMRSIRDVLDPMGVGWGESGVSNHEVPPASEEMTTVFNSTRLLWESTLLFPSTFQLSDFGGMQIGIRMRSIHVCKHSTQVHAGQFFFFFLSA